MALIFAKFGAYLINTSKVTSRKLMAPVSLAHSKSLLILLCDF